MATYTITEVSETYEEWSNNYGTFHTYTVRATDPQGQTRTFTMNRKAKEGESAPPQIGEIDGYEEPAKGDFPPKLKINYQQQGGGSQQTVSQGATSTGGGMSKDDYWNRKDERDVAAQKRMGRAHAQDMALRFVEATGDAKDLRMDDAEVVRTYLNGPLKKLTDFFEQDVQEAGERE